MNIKVRIGGGTPVDEVAFDDLAQRIEVNIQGEIKRLLGGGNIVNEDSRSLIVREAVRAAVRDFTRNSR